jgi:hypothetical protein
MNDSEDLQFKMKKKITVILFVVFDLLYFAEIKDILCLSFHHRNLLKSM